MNKWMIWGFSHYFWVDTQLAELAVSIARITESHRDLLQLPCVEVYPLGSNGTTKIHPGWSGKEMGGVGNSNGNHLVGGENHQPI